MASNADVCSSSTANAGFWKSKRAMHNRCCSPTDITDCHGVTSYSTALKEPIDAICRSKNFPRVTSFKICLHPFQMSVQYKTQEADDQ